MPGSQCGYYLLTSTGSIRNPLPTIGIKHIVAHIVHDLNSLHFRVDIQGVFNHAKHLVPARVVVHTAGGVDNENNVLAIHRYTTYGVVIRCRAVGQQPLHFFGQALPGDGEPPYLIGGVI